MVAKQIEKQQTSFSTKQMSEYLKSLPMPKQVKLLNDVLVSFAEGDLGQYHLSIPKGTITKIDDIRNTDFSYLTDSVYKSNISYLIQQINFQLWIYKLFRPDFSLENGFFYMLQTQLGIMIETLVAAVLYNPFIEPNKDRSLGDVKAQYKDIGQVIKGMSFAKMIRLCREKKILSQEAIIQIDQIRDSRNEEIHLHGIDFRIYNNFDFGRFKEKYDLVISILKELQVHFQKAPIHHNATDLRKYFFGYEKNQEIFEGSIVALKEEHFYGFVKIAKASEGIYFQYQENDNLDRKQNVRFRVIETESGLMAKDIQPL